MSERIVDEEFVRGLEEDRRLRRSLDWRFSQLEELIKRGEREILESPRKGVRSAFKRLLFKLIGPALRPFLRHQRELESERLKLLREVWEQSEARLTAAEDRLLHAYIKGGESLAALRGDILAGFNDKVTEARKGAAAEALAGLRAELERHRDETRESARRVEADIISRTDLIADRIGREVDALSHDLQHHLKLSERRVDDFSEALDRLKRQVEQVREHSRLTVGEAGSGAQEQQATVGPARGDEEYAAHQERFRGSPEEIERRQRLYIEHFRGRGRPVLDVGCGRGEFLGLLKEEGIEATGIDINSASVKACKKRKLEAQQADFFKYCEDLDDGSLGGIFAAQVVEHLEPAQLTTFFEQALRVLKPGGVLVAETVNPESVFALTRFYYLDSTHRAPLPPLLLQFTAERVGFSKAEIKLISALPEDEMLRTVDTGMGLPPALEDAFAVLNSDIERLNAFLYGHLEYALIAEK